MAEKKTKKAKSKMNREYRKKQTLVHWPKVVPYKKEPGDKKGKSMWKEGARKHTVQEWKKGLKDALVDDFNTVKASVMRDIKAVAKRLKK